MLELEGLQRVFGRVPEDPGGIVGREVELCEPQLKVEYDPSLVTETDVERG